MIGKALPKWCWDYLQTCPPSGQGIHKWLAGAAIRVLKHVGIDEATELLNLAARGGHATAKQLREIRDAVGWAAQILAKKGLEYKEEPKAYLPANVELIQEIEVQGDGLDELSANTPTKPLSDTEQLIDVLFPLDCLLCVGCAPTDKITGPRQEMRGGLATQQYIVPSPMSAVTGLNQDNEASERCLDNTGPRRFLITEFDFGPDTLDCQANLIWHLKQATGYPLTLVLWSGSKSLHAWWYVKGISKAPADDSSTFHFFRYATRLGADPRLWTRGQFVRMPGGWNYKTQRRQEVYYFDPKTIL